MDLWGTPVLASRTFSLFFLLLITMSDDDALYENELKMEKNKEQPEHGWNACGVCAHFVASMCTPRQSPTHAMFACVHALREVVGVECKAFVA